MQISKLLQATKLGIWKAFESIEATQFSFIQQINRHQYLGENKNI